MLRLSLLFQLILALVLLYTSTCFAETDDYSKETKAMFDRLNVDYPGLEKVKAALKSGDYKAAEAAYLDFYKTRTTPVLYWKDLYPAMDTFQVRSSYFDFFKTAPERITYRDRNTLKYLISKERGYDWGNTKPNQYTLVKLADLMLQNKIYHPWWPNEPVQDLGPDWNWDHIPADGDQSWNFHLHHQEFLLALAQAYWQTGDEKYVKKLVEVWTDWIKRVNHPINLSHLIQPILYQQLLSFALSWDGFTPHDFCLIQSWLATSNADVLMAEPRSGNQLMGTAIALIWLGVGMPEFTNSQSWRDEGWKRMENFLGAESSYPDGSAKEGTYHYAVGPHWSVLDGVKLARMNKLSYPDSLKEKLVDAASFFAYTAKPDGKWVWTGDGDRGTAFPYVMTMANQENREDLKYIASFGKEGRKPEKLSVWYPYVGYCTMRNSWSKSSNYLFFDVGPAGILHRHADKLSIEVASYGRSLLEDMGIHTYSTDPRETPQLALASSSRAHNTVIVDGKSQTDPEEASDTPLTNPWTSTPVLDFNIGDYSGPYVDVHGEQQFYGGDISNLVHQRSVVFVKPDYWIVTDRILPKDKPDGVVHIYEQLHHFIPIELDHDTVTNAVWSTTPGKPNLALIPVNDPGLHIEIAEGRTEPYPQGYYYQDTGQRVVPAPCVIYRLEQATPAIIQTVLYPQKKGQNNHPKVERIGDPKDGTIRVTFADGRYDLYCSPASPGKHTFGEVSFDGIAALVRFDKNGKVRVSEVVGSRSITVGAKIYTK